MMNQPINVSSIADVWDRFSILNGMGAAIKSQTGKYCDLNKSQLSFAQKMTNNIGLLEL